jgi:hypothetical protein
VSPVNWSARTSRGSPRPSRRPDGSQLELTDRLGSSEEQGDDVDSVSRDEVVRAGDLARDANGDTANTPNSAAVNSPKSSLCLIAVSPSRV